MRTRLVRPALGLAVVLGLALGLVACADPAVPDPSDPPAPTAPTTTLAPPAQGSGSDGLTVRYLEGGSVKTLRVEDFPR